MSGGSEDAQTGATTTARLTLDDLPLRGDLVGQQPYGAPQLNVPVRLNVNENPYPPTGRVRSQMATALAEAAKTINRYPDREAALLRADLAAFLGHGLEANQIWVGNGSNEVLTHLLQAFGGPKRRVLTFAPTYSMYPEYARDTHTEFVAVPRREDFGLDADMVVEAVAAHDPTLILIANPNNPTGTRTPVAVIADICARVNCLVVVDEAYQEFTEYPEDSTLALLPGHPRLIVVRTMSKAFALAGGRVGYLAAAPAIVDACRMVRLPYHLSASTQAVARVALANAPTLLAQVSRLRAQIQQLQRWLVAQGLTVPPSEANFCLFGPFDDRHAVWRGLLDRGVLVRETGPEGYLRVCAGTPMEMAAFRAALLAVLQPVDQPTQVLEGRRR